MPPPGRRYVVPCRAAGEQERHGQDFDPRDQQITPSIGLGRAVNANFLEDLAESPERAFFAGTSRELGQIYRGISAALCERGPAVLDIIPKTKDVFSIEELGS